VDLTMYTKFLRKLLWKIESSMDGHCGPVGHCISDEEVFNAQYTFEKLK